jgi:purine-binding chemotaxis protein CheW
MTPEKKKKPVQLEDSQPETATGKSALPPQPPAPVFPLVPIEIDIDLAELNKQTALLASDDQIVASSLPPQPQAPVFSPVSSEGALAPEVEVRPISNSKTEPKSSAPPSQKDTSIHKDLQLVVFALAGELFGLDIAVVESIIKMQGITELPHVAAYIKGVTNLRGSVLPVIDLRTRFSLEEKEDTRQTRIIVVTLGNIKVGMIVDAVSEVLRVSSELIEPPMINSVSASFLKGIVRLENRLIILLELSKVLNLKEKQVEEALAA